MSPEIKLFNTKSRSLETFVPLHKNKVSIYSCGPTVYHYQHLGNMRAAVFADTLHRMFKADGYTINHIINITDVGHNTDDGDNGEDKMEKGSRREGKNVWDIAKMYTDAYLQDLESLNINLKEYTFPRATDNIQEQINLVLKLEYRGYTYVISDGIYFDTSKFKAYGDFAKLDIKGLKSGARVEDKGEKKNITDFALWKFSPKNEQRQMEWSSPWGKGFPGWHIECSAMAMKYLGNHFDIHTGGIEHIQVHHTNEIAQSECTTGETYVNYWMHNNHLQDTTGKMSKSSGDFLTISSIIEKGYSPLAYRYFLLLAHYRKEVVFSYEALDSASKAYLKLADYTLRLQGTSGIVQKDYLTTVVEALHHDLNTATAIATLWNLIKDDSVSDTDTYATILAINELLGLGLEPATLKKETITIPHEVQLLLDARKDARTTKNFKESDRLRDEILKAGFIVKDTSEGQQVMKHSS
jgi:cysteinyl-tRNA synthetase